jgi:DNA-binding response OmpR family regulator
MVVEDDVLVGLDLLEQLVEVGFDAVGPFVTVSDAVCEFDTNGCDAAVLDVNLGRETSEPLVLALKDKSVPFVVLSGYSREQHPVAFRGEITASKPVHVPELVRILNELL